MFELARMWLMKKQEIKPANLIFRPQRKVKFLTMNRLPLALTTCSCSGKAKASLTRTCQAATLTSSTIRWRSQNAKISQLSSISNRIGILKRDSSLQPRIAQSKGKLQECLRILIKRLIYLRTPQIEKRNI